MIRVILSFDTEDFVSPRSDDAAKALAQIMASHRVRGCFCMVGDKVRALLARGRRDVIDALREHEIHYHTNTHGFWPKTALYLDGLSWDDGVERLLANEASGVDLVEDVLGQRPTAYAKTDTHWAAQQIHGFNIAHRIHWANIGAERISKIKQSRSFADIVLRHALPMLVY